MLDGWDLAVIAAAVIGYSLCSRRLEGSPVTAPIVFTGIGVIAGGEVSGVIDLSAGSGELRLLAEVTLALVLFSDASSLDAGALRRESSLPARLLVIALPLTIVVGTLLALPLFDGIGIFAAVSLAVVLAPTDAALGQSVVSDRRLPRSLRQGLNVESGLNDGVCVPLLVTSIAFAQLEEAPDFDGQVLVDLVKEVAIAVAVGGAIGLIVVALIRASSRRAWLSDSWRGMIPLASAGAAYAVTAELHGSGFIGAFVAGLVFGRLVGDQRAESVELLEQAGALLSGATFLLFGAAVVGPAFGRIDVQLVGYAVLSLTVVRMLPVAVSLVGSGARGPTMAFAGWFGPRGLATIVFSLTLVEESGIADAQRLTDVATVVVVGSVLAHGLSAPWLTDRYAAWLGSQTDAW